MGMPRTVGRTKRGFSGTALAALAWLAVATGCPTSGEPTYVTDEQGGALILHGVNANNGAKYDPLRVGWTTEPDIQRLTTWGFDVVRLLVLWDGLEPAPGVYDQAYLERVAERVRWCGNAGLHVILDMHQDLYAARFGGDGAPAWAIRDDGFPFTPLEPWWLNYTQPAVIHSFDHFFQDADLQDRYEQAWLTLANRFRDEPAVLGYDLMNEPYPGSEPLGDFESGTLTAFSDRLSHAIHAVDADAWVFYEPVAFTANMGLPSAIGVLTDERVAYFPHFYQLDVHEGGAYSGDTSFMELWKANRIAEASRQKAPLLLGEFGASADGAGHVEYLKDVTAMADAAGAGWTYWSYDREDGSFGFIDSSGAEKAQLEALVRVYPERIAGKPVSFSYDPDARVFELVFDDAPGVSGATRIVLPASRLYPGGWELSVSDLAGTWSSSFDAASQRLTLVTGSSAARHTVRITPAVPG